LHRADGFASGATRAGITRSDWDRTFSFSQSYVCELLWGVDKHWLNRGIAASVLGKWQPAGILSLMTETAGSFDLDRSGRPLGQAMGLASS
jgi:hypothetical protein